MRVMNAKRRVTGGLALLGVAVVVALAGCGSSDKPATSTDGSATGPNGAESQSAEQLFADSTEAIKRASSVTINGAGRQSGGATLKLNLQLTRDGGHGTVDLLGTRFQVVRVGEAFYVKGSPLLYRRLEFTNVPPGAWVKTSPNNSLAAFTDLAGEAAGITSTTRTITKGATTTIAGQPVVELKTGGKLYKGRLYLKATGEPYPVKLEKRGRETATFTFSNWNTTPAPTAPAAATVVER